MKNDLYLRRTILNWKRKFNIDIPNDKHYEFKTNKKYYLKLPDLDPVLIRIILASIPPTREGLDGVFVRLDGGLTIGEDVPLLGIESD